MRISPRSTAAMAGSASGFILQNHWFDIRGSTIVLLRSQIPIACVCSFTFSSSPCAFKSSTILCRALNKYSGTAFVPALQKLHKSAAPLCCLYVNKIVERLKGARTVLEKVNENTHHVDRNFASGQDDSIVPRITQRMVHAK